MSGVKLSSNSTLEFDFLLILSTLKMIIDYDSDRHHPIRLSDLLYERWSWEKFYWDSTSTYEADSSINLIWAVFKVESEETDRR